MNEEEVLRILLETEPTDRSDYVLNGKPPVWPILTSGENTLFIHPKEVRLNREGDLGSGFFWQWKGPKGWIDQGYSGSWPSLEKEIQKAVEAGAQPYHADDTRPSIT